MRALIALVLLTAIVPASQARQIENCRAIKDKDQRLACFDQSAGNSGGEECDSREPGKFNADCINEKLQKQRR
ncbi:hypothetical protein [Agrobacterium tumefaciens]|uniref:Uncharacterized protein n=1 Tax=Agrobacterium tumefaciens TaxID=358 RepID=A0AA44F166_AGRTU|nr:hypothetical protein [Agrobacterium tumefaciens]NSL22026.1 hypothetical protein [Agrobacterium tumefaciens]NTB85798.1 hypothetical protein [Agrobacterium tumefaciens]NTC19406.1 hypothetical protein [Agrobacterium tumefaciens]NTC26618.1 hypothetical protein [Agrobacterium tumefaciens]NTC57892.1 hypothetical protein [Agrobacterium tumefaciens]